MFVKFASGKLKLMLLNFDLRKKYFPVLKECRTFGGGNSTVICPNLPKSCQNLLEKIMSFSEV